MKLSLASIERDGVVSVHASGSMTGADLTDADGKDPFEQVLGANWKSSRVLLDLSDVNYVDSSAIGWLIGAQRRFKEGGGQLVVHSVQPTVRQILDVLKIGKVVPLAENELAAREMIAGSTPGGTR